jgi:hypothetical protein
MVERLPYYGFRLFYRIHIVLVTARQHVSFIFLASFPYNTPHRLRDTLLRLLFPHRPLLISY